jgi:hypothetical protein
MAKAIKFTNEEVQEIEKLRADVAQVFTKLGQLDIERKRRLKELDDIQSDLHDAHAKLVETEKKLFEGLNEKYGDGNYNPQTNEFTPVESTEEVKEEVSEVEN